MGVLQRSVQIRITGRFSSPEPVSGWIFGILLGLGIWHCCHVHTCHTGVPSFESSSAPSFSFLSMHSLEGSS